jgi:hypothetical protein
MQDCEVWCALQPLVAQGFVQGFEIRSGKKPWVADCRLSPQTPGRSRTMQRSPPQGRGAPTPRPCHHSPQHVPLAQPHPLAALLWAVPVLAALLWAGDSQLAAAALNFLISGVCLVQQLEWHACLAAAPPRTPCGGCGGEHLCLKPPAWLRSCECGSPFPAAHSLARTVCPPCRTPGPCMRCSQASLASHMATLRCLSMRAV